MTVSQAGAPRSTGIESLRGIAALGVLAAHVFGAAGAYSMATVGDRLLLGGGLGVWLFFALSGFLLYRPFARHAFDSAAAPRLGRYARNRAVRILPLYYAVLAVLLVVNHGGGSVEQWWRFATFSQSYFAGTVGTVDGPMWSLVVEIQFYALLPLVAWGIARLAGGSRLRAALAIVALGAASFVVWWKQVHTAGFTDLRWEWSFPVCFAGFVPGMLLALVPRNRRVGTRAAAALAAGSVPLWLIAADRIDWAQHIATVAGAMLLAAVAFGPPVRPLEWRPLAAIGVASYSLYLWHMPIVDSLDRHVGLPAVPALAVALAVCLAVAAASYWAIERPFLRLRRRWAAQPSSYDAIPGTAGSSPLNVLTKPASADASTANVSNPSSIVS